MEQLSTGSPPVIYRHRLPVRVMHWINVICLVVLLMSGLQIFNAHPALYWGDDSRDSTRVMQITQKQVDGQWRGVTRVGAAEFNTHGVLGTSRGEGRRVRERGPFPPGRPSPVRSGCRWAGSGISSSPGFSSSTASRTSPGRSSAATCARDLVPTGGEVRGIGRSLRDHLLLRHPHGEEARRYNVLQNIAYLSIIFIVLPLIVLGGWAMSPMMDAFWPGWVDWLGGRQAARTLHFVAAVLLVAFVLVHLFEVIVTGLVNNLRSMITGYWRLPK